MVIASSMLILFVCGGCIDAKENGDKDDDEGEGDEGDADGENVDDDEWEDCNYGIVIGVIRVLNEQAVDKYNIEPGPLEKVLVQIGDAKENILFWSGYSDELGMVNYEFDGLSWSYRMDFNWVYEPPNGDPWSRCCGGKIIHKDLKCDAENDDIEVVLSIWCDTEMC
ncbi:hypothetical protein K8I61_02170 [bacterium]|nr:hypothetical protein [bacterium]